MSVSVVIRGVQNAERAFRMLNTETRARARVALSESLAEAKAGTLSRVHRLSGELAATVRTEMYADSPGVQPAGVLEIGYGTLRRRSRSTGKRKSRQKGTTLANTQPGVYAMVEEFGDAKRNHVAHPAVVPAIEETRPHHLARMAAALSSSVDAVAAVTGGDV